MCGSTSTCLRLMLVLLAVWLTGSPLVAQEPVRIALRNQVDVHSDVVTLSQLATIDGGDSRTRQYISNLDFSADAKHRIDSDVKYTWKGPYHFTKHKSKN